MFYIVLVDSEQGTGINGSIKIDMVMKYVKGNKIAFK